MPADFVLDAFQDPRVVVVHLIGGVRAHCGHADRLRECIDGRTGRSISAQ